MAIINIAVTESSGVVASIGSENPVSVSISAQPTTGLVIEPLEPAVVGLTTGQGPAGPPGPAGTAVGTIADTISADTGNSIALGTDNKFYVPAPQFASTQW